MRSTLKIREMTAAILGSVSANVYADLTKVYERALRSPTPGDMRGPTIGEIREFDKEMHIQVIRQMIRDPEASLEGGINWYLDNRRDTRWHTLNIKPDWWPDQSVIASSVEPTPAIGDKRKRLDEVAPIKPAAVMMCRFCNKPRADHLRKRWCSGPKTAVVIAPKGKGASKGAGKTLPPWMIGKASRGPADPTQPNGSPICWAFHDPNSTCLVPLCTKSHRCPNYLKIGGVCNKAHKASNCDSDCA
jgi:hypothetical protein